MNLIENEYENDERYAQLIQDMTETETEEILEEILNDKIEIKYPDVNSFNIKVLVTEYDVPSRKENYELVKAYKSGNKNALDEIVLRNGRLVYFVLKRYAYYEDDYMEDLAQEGFLGLCRAVEMFDLEKDIAFSTYAVFWIKQRISRYILNTGRSIRIPIHLSGKIQKLAYIERKLRDKKGHIYISVNELAKETGFSTTDIIAYKEYMLPIMSLETPLNTGNDHDNELYLKDYIKSNVSVEKEALHPIINEQVRDILTQALTEREYEIICKRFGIIDGRCRTLADIGEDYGICRERVRQIESVAVRKLKRTKYSKTLKQLIGA